MSEKNGQVKKNVPWHILAPSAVACDMFLLRASAHHWHVSAFLCNREFQGISHYTKNRLPNEWFPVRGLLFVTACLSLSNSAIFTCVLLFTHTCPVTEFTVASHLNTANSCCHHVFLRHFRFQKCLPVNSNTCVPQPLTPSSLSARRDRAAAFQPPSCQSSGESAF